MLARLAGPLVPTFLGEDKEPAYWSIYTFQTQIAASSSPFSVSLVGASVSHVLVYRQAAVSAGISPPEQSPDHAP